MRSVSEFEEFAEVWAGAWEAVGRNVTAGAIEIASGVLEDYPVAAIRAALVRHLRVSRNPPAPADILALLAASDGRPEAAEAWGLVAPLLVDREQRVTAVITDEMRVAWGAAAEVYARDPVGARLAFREVYDREVAAARAQRRPVAWQPVVGWDRAAREPVLQEAQRLGRLSPDEVSQHVPAAMPALDRVIALLEDHGAAARGAVADDAAPWPGCVPEFRTLATLRALRQRLERSPPVSPEDAARRAAEEARRRAAADEYLQRLNTEALAAATERLAADQVPLPKAGRG